MISSVMRANLKREDDDSSTRRSQVPCQDPDSSIASCHDLRLRPPVHTLASARPLASGLNTVDSFIVKQLRGLLPTSWTMKALV